MTLSKEEQLREQLFFHSILTRLKELIHLDTTLQKSFRPLNFSLSFYTPFQSRITLHFERGQCKIGTIKKPTIKLLFFSKKQILRLMEKKKTLPPLPIRGLFKWRALRSVNKATKALQYYLAPPPFQNISLCKIHVELVFATLLSAFCYLVKRVPKLRTQVKRGPFGTILFFPSPQSQPFWLELSSSEALWGRGSPPNPADVLLSFADFTVAAEALNRKIDTYSAIGLGRIQMSGFLPLADHIDSLFESVHPYLEKPS